MSTLQRFFTSMIASTILMASFTASAQSQRGPSTPEERARVIAIAEASDKDPLAVRQSEDSKWFAKWREEVPEYQFADNKGALWAKTEARGDLRKVARFQLDISTAAYQVKHQIFDPEKDTNIELAVTIAAVEGLLRAYETLLPKRPENRSEKMDLALDSRNKGELTAFVKALEPLPSR